MISMLCTELSHATKYQVTWCAEGKRPPLARVTCIPMKSINPFKTLLTISYPLWTLPSLHRLWRHIGTADIVHVHNHVMFGPFMGFMMAKIRGKKTVVTLHNPPWVEVFNSFNPVLRIIAGKVKNGLSWIVLRYATQITAVSPFAQRSLRMTMGRSSSLIENGADTSVFRTVSPQQRSSLRRSFGWSEDDKILLFVGRFVSNKGLDVIPRIAERYPEWQWYLVGASVGTGTIDPRSWKHPSVHVMGAIADRKKLAQYYQAADCLVQPSIAKTEGMSLAMLEAIACGLPCIVTAQNVRKSHDDFIHIVQNPADARSWKIAVARATRTSSGSPSAKRRHEAFLRKHSWSLIAQQYETIYDRCMDIEAEKGLV